MRTRGDHLMIRATVLLTWMFSLGCGTTNTRDATHQLLISEAVDRSVAQMDFRSLAGEDVYFNTEYVRNIKGVGFVNAEYIISSLRQQLVASDCRLQDKPEDADFIVEARVGALGADGHEFMLGVPKNDALSGVSAAIPSAPVIPAIPEVSFAKRNAQTGAAKIAVFAYHRETKQPVWQSGISLARSNAKDTWILGAGPFQSGTIHDGTKFAGANLEVPLLHGDEPERPQSSVSYFDEQRFAPPLRRLNAGPEVELATFEEEDTAHRPVEKKDVRQFDQEPSPREGIHDP